MQAIDIIVVDELQRKRSAEDGELAMWDLEEGVTGLARKRSAVLEDGSEASTPFQRRRVRFLETSSLFFFDDDSSEPLSFAASASSVSGVGAEGQGSQLGLAAAVAAAVAGGGEVVVVESADEIEGPVNMSGGEEEEDEQENSGDSRRRRGAYEEEEEDVLMVVSSDEEESDAGSSSSSGASSYLSSRNSSALSSPSSWEREEIVTTKMEDGVSVEAAAFDRLIVHFFEKKQIRQVKDILSLYSGWDEYSVYKSLDNRLTAVMETLRLRGKMSVLPSTLQLTAPMLPFLEYLQGLVQKALLHTVAGGLLQ